MSRVPVAILTVFMAIVAILVVYTLSQGVVGGPTHIKSSTTGQGAMLNTTSKVLEEWRRVLEAYANTTAGQSKTSITATWIQGVLETGQPAEIKVIGLKPATYPYHNLYYSSTNVQVAGVDELDIVKLNGTHIAVAVQDKVKVFHVYPPSSARLVEVIDVDNIVSRLRGPEYLVLVSKNTTTTIARVASRIGVAGLFYNGSKLIVVAVEYRQPALVEPRTWILCFNGSLGLEYYATVPGVAYDARMLRNMLVVVTRTGLTIPVILSHGGKLIPEPVPIGVRPEETIIAVINTTNWRIASKSLVGVNPSSLYVTASGDIYVVSQINPYIVKPLATLPGIAGWPSKGPSTLIVRLSIGRGPSIHVDANTTIPGIVWKQWMLDVYNNVLRVVVEDWVRGSLRVNIYTFNASSLKLIGSLLNVTVNERVHGVRFIGSKLYLVTYRRVDPLFTIDLSDPRHPRVVGYIEGPGFDEYLHPVAKNMILGVGVEERRIRVTLYMVSSNGTLKPYSRIYIDGFTWSPLLSRSRWSHHALTYNSVRGEVYIPVYAWRHGVKVSGIAVITIEKGKLGLRAIITHPLATRTGFVDDILYTISPQNPIETIRAYRLEDLRLIKSVPGYVRVRVADIASNPSAYEDRGVEVVGVIVGSTRIGFMDAILVSDGSGSIPVASYSIYVGHYTSTLALKEGFKVRIVGVVAMYRGQPYIIPYMVSRLD